MNITLQNICNFILNNIVNNNCIEYDAIMKEVNKNLEFTSDYSHKLTIQFFKDKNIVILNNGKIHDCNFTIDELRQLKKIIKESNSADDIDTTSLVSNFPKNKLEIAERYLEEQLIINLEDDLNKDIETKEDDSEVKSEVLDSYNEDSFKTYLSSIGQYKLLTAEEEIALARASRNGDVKAREKLINHNLRLVVNIAKHFLNKGLSIDDLIQLGNMGLINAVNKFDPDLGFKLSTYATWWIKQSIWRGLSSESRLVRIPAYVAEQAQKIKKAKQTLQLSLDREPSLKEIADYVNENKMYSSSVNHVTERDINIYMDFYDINSVGSLDTPITNNDGDQDNTIGDFIPSDEKNPEDSAITNSLTNTMTDVMNRVLKENEINVIVKRFGLFGNRPHTLEEIAEECGVTRERIRQVESKALAKLRRSMYSRIQLRDYVDDI